MLEHYPATYTDAYGTEETAITNDGKDLRMVLRGVEFTCKDFDSFEPAQDATPEQLNCFMFTSHWLCAYRLEWQMPITVHDNGKVTVSKLSIRHRLGKANSRGGVADLELSITLNYAGQHYTDSGNSGWFEDELLEIQKQLPDGVYMKACINCLYSDYSVYGHCCFGDMMCFRNNKQQYLQVTTKQEYMQIGPGPNSDVQETYLCPEFERRVPGTGYRG